MIETSDKNSIAINVNTEYLQEHSRPEKQQYTFSYTITITNRSEQPIRLLRRHWIITDANNDIQEVEGEGVIGEQPLIPAGESYRYSSGAVLKTEIGTMQGSYQMQRPDGSLFDAPIAVFSLQKPGILH